ncbi:hypothetical protein F8M41_012656 [Gigaspora margarita]|uniref:Uncharacterized protein n=1 Tax=Gigaspora margarita TaxID=4874 RepID=A0A8H4AT03_GIGMA|nr:hypothetical protein F8M41_012656 [Gigaspora margarita]
MVANLQVSVKKVSDEDPKSDAPRRESSLFEWYWDNFGRDDSVEKVESTEEKTVNIVNTDRETVDEAKVENLPESLDEEGIGNDEVNAVESCRKSVDENNINECSNGHYYDKEDKNKKDKNKRTYLLPKR